MEIIFFYNENICEYFKANYSIISVSVSGFQLNSAGDSHLHWTVAYLFDIEYGYIYGHPIITVICFSIYTLYLLDLIDNMKMPFLW